MCTFQLLFPGEVRYLSDAQHGVTNLTPSPGVRVKADPTTESHRCVLARALFAAALFRA
jgi:hypothetical protein